MKPMKQKLKVGADGAYKQRSEVEGVKIPEIWSRDTPRCRP